MQQPKHDMASCHARHLRERPGFIGDETKRSDGGNDVDAFVRQRQRAHVALHVFDLAAESVRVSQHDRVAIDTRNARPGGGEAATEPTGATAGIEYARSDADPTETNELLRLNGAHPGAAWRFVPGLVIAGGYVPIHGFRSGPGRAALWSTIKIMPPSLLSYTLDGIDGRHCLFLLK